MLKDNTYRIAITLPYLYTVRDILFTPVWEEMKKYKHVHFFLLCNDPGIGEMINKRNCTNITYVKYPAKRSWRNFNWYIILSLIYKIFDAKYIYDSVVYRFGAVNNLSHYHIRKKRGFDERKRQKIFTDYSKGAVAGFPFPTSKFVFRMLYELRHSFFNATTREDEILLRDLNLDLFVFGRLHLNTTEYWARLLKKIGIPMIGIISSWDHPTTKGATPRGMSGYIVASKCMVEEMAELHGIDRKKISQIGKVQMDEYLATDTLLTREKFFDLLGVPQGNKLITMGTNTTGLKEHEVSIARKLAMNTARGQYGETTLLIRSHPQDIDWQRDFLPLADYPKVICYNACSFGHMGQSDLANAKQDRIMLANLMKYSDVVIQSRGSLALDAIAFDTPVISLAFDGDLKRPLNDSFLFEYEYEHFKPIVRAKGTWLVGSYAELDRAILGFLKDPAFQAEGRVKIREEQIEPLDGNACKRLVDEIVKSATKAKAGCLASGDWNHSGLGDLAWSAKQKINLFEYLKK